MNIGTGSGTLVHEIVHPFMRANFPNCPAWFNEGLASLYEASVEKNGHIQGLINWRFKGLEKAIKEGRTISFQQLTSMSEAQFYGGASYSEHYAQARYLCYYLQEKGLLAKFYHQLLTLNRIQPAIPRLNGFWGKTTWKFLRATGKNSSSICERRKLLCGDNM